MRHPTDPKVRIIRINGIDVPPDYIREKSLGWAYQPQGVAPPGYRQIWGFQCVTTESACDGHKPNHYYSAAENPVNGNWQRTRVITWTIAPAGACPAGQVMISRLGRFANGNREYTVEHWPSATPPAGWEYAEPLGCVWSS